MGVQIPHGRGQFEGFDAHQFCGFFNRIRGGKTCSICVRKINKILIKTVCISGILILCTFQRYTSLHDSSWVFRHPAATKDYDIDIIELQQ